ncbi:hypothetical protein [Mesorhizobium sp. LNJC391B00]|uniref:hypothetical protein n=1 Tax=Mesorhizobium sp. LNJC391B00 TaxID=1287273 RepID=UPI0012EB99FB|nr:hypothetical protein [Mesorhizobium sp. LNJC391B00]
MAHDKRLTYRRIGEASLAQAEGEATPKQAKKEVGSRLGGLLMAQETFTKESFWAELDKLGESEVRTRVVTKRYGEVGQKRALAEDWLQDLDRNRASLSNLEQIRIARSAKNAAWAAAVAAIIAAVCAIVAIVVVL